MIPHWWDLDLGLGANGCGVEVVQRKLGVPVTGFYDESTAAAVRSFQRRQKIPVTGVVDRETSVRIGEPASYGLTPTWFTRELRPHLVGEDVRELRRKLNVEQGNAFDFELSEAVRRLQSQLGLDLTGHVDRDLATHLGD